MEPLTDTQGTDAELAYACRRLWLAIVSSAIADSVGVYPELLDDARRWLCSRECSTACELIDIDQCQLLDRLETAWQRYDTSPAKPSNSTALKLKSLLAVTA